MTSLFCLWLSVLLAACQPAEKFVQTQFSGPTMGTEYHVSIVTTENTKVGTDVAELIDRELVAVNQSMSTYIPDSELSKINLQQSEVWLPVSDNLLAVLTKAQNVSELSEGAFDITIAPLVNLWGFGPETKQNQLPTDADIISRLQQVGFKKLKLDLQRKTIQKTPGLQLDLSAIAKGFGADIVASMLEEKGYTNFMVEIGGEVVVKGHSVRGTAWRIGIETPTVGPSGVQQAIAISDVGVATSGDYRNYFEQNGERYSHTIDPTTGKPITHKLASVTVIAANAADADAFATAINVMGYASGKLFAEQNQLAVYFIRKQDDHFVSDYTPQFTKYLSEG